MTAARIEIAQRPNVHEMRKALVVKLVYQDYLDEKIQTIMRLICNLGEKGE
ncbi:MAG: hypothetical protein V7L11_22490 [Nostoc sp.]|uniref:hypothetical protein n=1 Tax=Nostoc sp. TaxID=1180 RepID=UPI002FFA2BBD